MIIILFICSWFTIHNNYHCGGYPHTINTRLQMVCSFIDTLCKYTTCIMRSLRLLMLLVDGWLWWPGDLWLKSADGIAAYKTAGSVALHWGSLDGACCSVKPDEAWERVDPAGPTKVLADLLSLVTLWLTERAARTREVQCWKCTC
jgi:hypothetical protein